MITINKKEEMEKYLVRNTYVFEDDVTINVNLDLEHLDLVCWELNCWNLECGNLKCRDLKCWNLKCWNLNCSNLNCRDLKCRKLRGWTLECMDLKCEDLKCNNLKCGNLSYHGFAIAYTSFRCKTAKARRENGFHICLDSEIEYITDEPKEIIEIDGVVFEKSKVEERLQGLEPLKGEE